jgi:galactokinase
MTCLNDLINSKDSLMPSAAAVLAERFGVSRDADAVGAFVPGRVEILGKHTDYAGGRSLLMAVSKGFRLVAAGRDDDIIRITAGPAFDDVQEFAYGQTPPHKPGHWVNHASTVGRRLAANFGDLRGADIAFISDLPIAAGMSSSSALIVAVFLGLAEINRLAETEIYRHNIHSNVELAGYISCVEMGGTFGTLTGQAGVGTFGGSEDHTSMLCCKPEMLSQFSFAPSLFERDIPFPAGMEMVIASSGVEAAKTGAALEKYNLVSIRARKAAEAYNHSTNPQCKNLRDVAVHAGADGLSDTMDAIGLGSTYEDAGMDLPGRFEQFYREDQQIIPAVGDALAAGNVEAIGELVDASHAGARAGLKNLIPETDFLQQSARQLGAIAASYFGAGFGGSVWAMITKNRAEEFRTAWEQSYTKHFPEPAKRAEFFITEPGEPAHIV